MLSPTEPNMSAQQPWPDELINKIGMTHILHLKTLHASEGRKFLAVSYPDLMAEEVSIALGICKPDLDAHNKFVPSSAYLASIRAHRTRSQFCAAAWISGASWGQLGAMFDVTRQSIMASAGKHLPEDRFKVRISHEPISLERLSAWYNWYADSLQMIESSKMSLNEIATRFLTITDD